MILPDASVLVIGGSSNAPGTVPVLETALYRQGVGWVTLEPSPVPRLYHHTAVLLPCGRVLVGGGDNRIQDQTYHHHDFHVFSPPYIEDGQNQRPVIVDLKDPTGQTAAQDPNDETFLLQGNQSNYRLDCTVQGIDSITKVVVIAPGSITHHSDMTARYVELPSATVSASQRLFALPDSRTLPRGYYMMFALNSGDIPSEAVWVKVQ